MVMMGHRRTFCLLLQLILSRGVRLGEEGRHVDRIVFGLEGQTVSFTIPEGRWHGREWAWPRALKPNRISFLGAEGVRTGFAIKDFSSEDEGRKYSVTSNGVVTNYRAVLAYRIEVDVGATLRITPEISGEIIWKYTPTSQTKATDFVDVLGHSMFVGRARMDATGKLSVSGWRWRDDGFFTAVINGTEFAANFQVVSIVRVETGDDLHLDPDLDPDLMGHINRFSWYRDNTPVVEFNAAGGGVVYNFPHCLTDSSNCHFDTITGKLTVKSWQHSYDGVFTMKVNGKLHKNGIKVVGDVTFVSFGNNMQLDPPHFEGELIRITWKYGRNLAAEYIGDHNILDYYTICKNDNCILDKTTGRLTVTSFDHSSDKTFTLEINGRTLPNEYVVVKKLADYDASVNVQRVTERLSKLICVGDFDGAGPVKYLWRKSGTTDWVQGTRVMETKHVFVSTVRIGYVYDACKIQNPVSEIVIVLNQ